VKVVISQPMFFPWVGMLEQIALADAYVHYTDVQFSKGSFVNRIQVKTATGIKWLTVPLAGRSIGSRISDVRIDNTRNWRRSHLDLLAQAYRGTPYRGEMLALVEQVYDPAHETIAALSSASLAALCKYFAIANPDAFLAIEDLHIDGGGSTRVLDVVRALSGTVYVTGLGARRYLDHEAFERAGVRVEYMDYAMAPYTQCHGAFTPYVSALDLIANAGAAGARCIVPKTVYWRDKLADEQTR
jgi:hypothetical protein